MAGTLDKTLGKIKETIGSLTGNTSLEAEGKKEQLVAMAKEFATALMGWGSEVAKEIKSSRSKA